MRLMPTLQDRTRTAVAAGFTKRDLAKAAGKTPAAISHWLRGRTLAIKADSAIGLAALTGWNVKWWAEGIGPRDQESPTRPAHQVSLADAKLSSPFIEWGVLEMIELPKAFKVAAPDDSMAPRLKAGQIAEFEVGLELRPGDGVLVKDAEGRPCIRRCRRVRGEWEAYAEDADNHLPFSIGPGQLLAVLVGVHARWG